MSQYYWRIYKLIAKVSSFRLRNAIGKVILESQHAFVVERQILDTSFIANKSMDARTGSGVAGFFFCKLDIEKSYDRVH